MFRICDVPTSPAPPLELKPVTENPLERLVREGFLNVLNAIQRMKDTATDIGDRVFPHSENAEGYAATVGEHPLTLTGPFGPTMAIRIESDCTSPIYLHPKGLSYKRGIRIKEGGMRRPEFWTPRVAMRRVTQIELIMTVLVDEPLRKFYVEVE